jgi:hypothetical protein
MIKYIWFYMRYGSTASEARTVNRNFSGRAPTNKPLRDEMERESNGQMSEAHSRLENNILNASTGTKSPTLIYNGKPQISHLFEWKETQFIQLSYLESFEQHLPCNISRINQHVWFTWIRSLLLTPIVIRYTDIYQRLLRETAAFLSSRPKRLSEHLPCTFFGSKAALWLNSINKLFSENSKQ